MWLIFDRVKDTGNVFHRIQNNGHKFCVGRHIIQNHLKNVNNIWKYIFQYIDTQERRSIEATEMFEPIYEFETNQTELPLRFLILYRKQLHYKLY